jgi:hypothetical protein
MNSDFGKTLSGISVEQKGARGGARRPLRAERR